MNEVIDQVAAELGNTRAVCRASYVASGRRHVVPRRTLVPQWRRPVGTKPAGITMDERRVLRLLKSAK